MGRLAFKLRCPQCKDKYFYRVNRLSWMRLLPKSKYYFCNKCSFYFLALFNISDIHERRKYKRYLVQNRLDVKLNAHLQNIGPVEDMSQQGLSFLYTQNGNPLRGKKELFLSNNSTGIILNTDPISFKVKSNLLVNADGKSTGRTTKKIGVQFIHLTKNQKNQLQSIIDGLSISRIRKKEKRRFKLLRSTPPLR